MELKKLRRHANESTYLVVSTRWAVVAPRCICILEILPDQYAVIREQYNKFTIQMREDVILVHHKWDF